MVFGIAGGLTACQKPQSNMTTTAAASTPVAQVASISSSIASNSSTNRLALSDVKLDEPLTQLVATTLNNGFLLAIYQHSNLSLTQKHCLADFDTQQTVNLAQGLLAHNLTDSELKEANEFYRLPVGQKIVQFNQNYFTKLKNGNTQAGTLDVTDDEKLQISAFIQTATGQKVQQLATTQLANTFAPIQNAQLQRCQISVSQFNQRSANASAVASTPKP